MSIVRGALVLTVLLSAVPARAAVITIDELPAEFGDALLTPGRQLVFGEPSIDFDIATDVFALRGHVFGVTEITFANTLAAGLPDSPFTVVVLQDAGLAAGTAANLIAAQLTTPGPGFFVYFNAGLQMPRLVFSADLSDPLADLAVLARLPNLSGAGGFAQMPTFSAANFTVVPEPASVALFGIAFAAVAIRRRRTEITAHRRR